MMLTFDQLSVWIFIMSFLGGVFGGLALEYGLHVWRYRCLKQSAATERLTRTQESSSC